MADTNLGTFIPDSVITVISRADMTPHIISGFVEGTFVSAERLTDASTLVQGADYSGYRIKRRNKAGTVTLTLHQSSASNDVLTLLYNEDMASDDNSTLFNISIVDASGRSVISAGQCFISRLAPLTMSTEGESREWVFQALALEQYIGGNAVIPPDILALIDELGGTIADKFRGGV